MYDLSAFDSRRLKFLNWLGHQPWLIFLPGICLVGGSVYIKFLGTGFVLMLALFATGYIWLKASSSLPGDVFGYSNELDKFFMDHATDWNFLKNQYQSLKRSSFMRHENFIWSVTIQNQEVPLMFTDDGGCVAWMQLDRSFPHLVVDSLADNHWFHRQLAKANVPPERIRLEGNFPDYFHVYQEPGQQVMTLQILAPDRMLYLIDNLRDINLEIQDNYLRLYAAHAQRSSHDFQAYLNVLGSFQIGLKVAGINNIR